MSSLINESIESPSVERAMTRKMSQAIGNSLFPALDSQLRSGRHIGMEDIDNYAFLMDYQLELEEFYQRYNVELIRAPEAFFYLRPRSTTLIPRSVLSEIEMLVGKVLCYLYLSPERLAQEGVFTLQDLNEELLALADEAKLLRLVNQRSTGTDLDRQKLFDKVKTALNRIKRLGMVVFINANDSSKFKINESIFRFGAEVKGGDDAQEAQLRLIRDGEAVALESGQPSSHPDNLQNDEENLDEIESENDDDVEDIK